VLERLKEVTKKAKKLNQIQLIVEVFTNVTIQSEIIEHITIEQLYIKGEDGLGNKLKSYSPFTVYAKTFERQPRQVTDRTTLRDSGKFYNSLKVLVNGNQVSIYSNDINDLTTRYGKDILTLSNESIQKIKPQIIEIAKRYVIETLLT